MNWMPEIPISINTIESDHHCHSKTEKRFSSIMDWCDDFGFVAKVSHSNIFFIVLWPYLTWLDYFNCYHIITKSLLCSFNSCYHSLSSFWLIDSKIGKQQQQQSFIKSIFWFKIFFRSHFIILLLNFSLLFLSF